MSKPSLHLAEISLAIVCPMANESATATAFVDAVLLHCSEVRRREFLAVVDLASTDATRQVLDLHATAVPELRVVWAPENRGVVDAYMRGYREALAAGPDWVLEIDAGFSHQPSDIPALLAKMAEGYDCVFGSRFGIAGSMMEGSAARYAISYGGTKLTNLLLGTRLTDMTSGFQLFSREALAKILERGVRSQGPFFQTEMKAYSRGLRVAEVPIHYRSPSHQVGRVALTDALLNLSRLFRARIAGNL